jgi:hypothetical protein
MRFGLLSVVANFIFWNILEGFPLTTQASAWYAGISLAGILLRAAIALYAFHTPWVASRLSEAPRSRSELQWGIAPHSSPSVDSPVAG